MFIVSQWSNKTVISYKIYYDGNSLKITEYIHPYYTHPDISPIFVNNSVIEIDYIAEIPEYACLLA